MYYIEKENKILFVDEDRDKLVATLSFQPNLTEDDIKEVEEGYTIKDFTLMTIEEAEDTEAKKERERLDSLSMTRGDVFEALILSKGLGKTQLRQMIEQAELDEVTKALYLNRFDEALEFYRGYPIFDLLGVQLGITSDMLDRFFDTKDYKYLTTHTLTINATPIEATVVGEGTYPYGTEVEVHVTLEGYKEYSNVVTLTEDTTLEVELEDEDTTDTDQPTDVQDEMETETNRETNEDSDTTGEQQDNADTSDAELQTPDSI